MRHFFLSFAKYWLVPLCLNVLAFGWVLGAYYHVPVLASAVRGLRCSFFDGAQKAAFTHEKFISHSAFAQTLNFGGNVAEEPAEVAGWRIFRPADPGQPAVIRLTLEGPEDAAIFFPRLSGEEASVEVAAVRGDGTKTLFRLNGAPGAWTPISAQYPLELVCARQDGAITLEITLRGRWAQLWNKNNQIFF